MTFLSAPDEERRCARFMNIAVLNKDKETVRQPALAYHSADSKLMNEHMLWYEERDITSELVLTSEFCSYCVFIDSLLHR